MPNTTTALLLYENVRISGDNTSSNAVNQGSGPDNGARSEFAVTETGTYLIVVDADGEGTGTYSLYVKETTCPSN